MSLELYSFWRSSASYRVRIALGLKSLPYAYHGVNLVKDGGEQWGAAYKDVNPQSRVPTLVHDGQRITQSLAIIEYLDEVFPGNKLIPHDPVDRARVRMLSQIIASDIQPLQNTSTTVYLKNVLKLNDAAIATWLREWITRGLDAYDAHLERDRLSGRFSHGDTPTMADCCLVPQMFAAQRFGVEPAKYPRLALIWENCNQLSAFAAAHPAKQVDAQ
ncbi:MAG TPA: maleylacetoacetate isomerase [Steroidobacteraceae bacterium]|nr:maleylacetoacetate isomerase [Steroidobacteraceae bacterium]